MLAYIHVISGVWRVAVAETTIDKEGNSRPLVGAHRASYVHILFLCLLRVLMHVLLHYLSLAFREDI